MRPLRRYILAADIGVVIADGAVVTVAVTQVVTVVEAGATEIPPDKSSGLR